MHGSQVVCGRSQLIRVAPEDRRENSGAISGVDHLSPLEVKRLCGRVDNRHLSV